MENSSTLLDSYSDEIIEDRNNDMKIEDEIDLYAIGIQPYGDLFIFNFAVDGSES